MEGGAKRPLPQSIQYQVMAAQGGQQLDLPAVFRVYDPKQVVDAAKTGPLFVQDLRTTK